MTPAIRDEITQIATDFLSGFKGMFDTINGTGWMVVDPLSGYLNAEGYENTLSQIPAKGDRPQVLLMEFTDGSVFIPAGEDLKSILPHATNWMWISGESIFGNKQSSLINGK